jgi:aryl-alcohol dehydrogenase-like predicted oxidoreductase
MNNIKKKIPELILGTANFGNTKYGLNKTRLNKNYVNKLIKNAISNKINFFDTASSYNSEKILSKERVKVFTKLVPIKKNLIKKNKKTIEKIVTYSIKNSLKKLGVKNIFCIMLHRVEDIKVLDGYVINVLKKFKKKKIIKHIGISIDRYKNIKEIVQNNDIKYIQLPINVYDNRWKIFLNKKYKENTKKKIFIARSIYLQGLFSKKKWPPKIEKYKKKILKINEFLIDNLKVSSIEELMFRYVKSFDQFNFILFGTTKIAIINRNKKYLKTKNFTDKEILLIEKNTKKVNKEFFDIIEWNK